VPQLQLHPDRLFPSDSKVRAIARELYETVKNLPIISPHGHTDPSWFANNTPFDNAADLLIKPDHYVFRMLYSQGIPLTDLGVPTADGSATSTDNRAIWRLFAANYHLFAATPSRMWLDHVFSEVFGFTNKLDSSTADQYFDAINEQLATPEFLPRALLDRFNIELIATTESALDTLPHHQKIQRDGLGHRVITAYRPDNVVDPDYEGFADNLAEFGRITGCDVSTWAGYLDAHRNRRAYFKSMGATSTDHGHPTARTANLSLTECEALYDIVKQGKATAEQADNFRGQVLTEMAGMCLEDGLVMQLHPGSVRNHNAQLFSQFGRDKGADIPERTEYVRALKPLLDKYGNEPNFTLILFTLDETVYSRELAPLAGHYPCLRLGPPWWFHDSPEGMRRFRQQATETAGIFNTAGFNDDTRAFLSIPARHDVARRMDCVSLAEWVSDHRIGLDEAMTLAQEMTYGLAKRAYKLG